QEHQQATRLYCKVGYAITVQIPYRYLRSPGSISVPTGRSIRISFELLERTIPFAQVGHDAALRIGTDPGNEIELAVSVQVSNRQRRGIPARCAARKIYLFSKMSRAVAQ